MSPRVSATCGVTADVSARAFGEGAQAGRSQRVRQEPRLCAPARGLGISEWHSVTSCWWLGAGRDASVYTTEVDRL